MRRSFVFLAPLSLCLLATFACEDDSSGSFGTFGLDSGSDLDSAARPTTTVDASPDDAEAAAAAVGVTVAVLGSATARANVEIVFQYADGTLETARTGADGTATSTGAAAPAMATALISGQNRFTPFTWTGIALGDVLSVPAIEADSNLIGTFNVTPATVDPKTTGLTFEATSVCAHGVTFPQGGAAALYTLDVYGECVPASGKSTLLAKQSSGSTLLGYAFAKDLAAPVAAGTATTLGAWAAPTTLTLSLTGGTGTNILSTQAMEIYDGASFNVQGPFSLVVPQTATTTYKVATGFASAYQASVITDNNGQAQQQTLRQSAGGTLSFDLSATLPAIGNSTASGDPQAPDFTWTGDTAATSGGAIQFSYPGTNKASYTWTILVPPGTTTVHLPKLPADATSFKPSDTAALGEYGNSGAADIAFLATTVLTPAAFRTKLASFPDVALGLIAATRYTPMPADGLYRVTSFHQNGT